MCGLVGFMTRTKASYQQEIKLERVIRKLLLLDVVRGYDSTGVAKIQENGDVLTSKQAVPSYIFLESARNIKFLTMNKTVGYIGHNRAATQGAVNNDNAHPFTHDHITLVHNGTLKNHRSLDGNFGTDSETVCYNFAKGNVKEVLEKVRGAFAFVWYDANDQTFNFARNEKRPLKIWDVDGNIMLWASESWMLRGAISEPFKDELKPQNEITDLAVGKWLKVPVNGGKPTIIDFTPAPEFESNLVTVNRYGNSDYTSPKDPVGAGTMMSLGVVPKTTILVEITKIGNKYTKNDLCTVEGKVISNAPNIPSMKFMAHSVSHSEITRQFDGGRIVATAKVVGDHMYQSNTLSCSDIVPRCGMKKFKSGNLPERFDGILESYLAYQEAAKTETAKAAEQEEGSDEPSFLDSDGKELTRKEFETIAKGGCTFCSHPIDIDAEEYGWYGKELMHEECMVEYEKEIKYSHGVH